MKKIQNAINSQRILPYNLPSIEPTPVSQTIIINNPNFNINYIQANNTTLQARLTHQDNWNLNCNLREFSETRQLGFFNAARQTKGPYDRRSPYAMPKAKTHDKKYFQIPIKRNQSHQQTNHHLSSNNHTIQRKIPQRKQLITNNTIQTIHTHGQNSNFRKRKYPNPTRSPISIINQTKIEKIEKGQKMQKIISPQLIQTERKAVEQIEHKTKINLRRNKFIDISELEPSNPQNSINYIEELQSPDIRRQDLISQDLKKNTNNNRNINQHLFSRTIDLIQNSFLNKVDDYLDGQNFREQLAPTTIELYVSSMRQPDRNSKPKTYKNNGLDDGFDFDFKFEEEKAKKRPKTPSKRKKMYED